MRTKQTPVAVIFYPFHKQIRNPKGIKQIAGTHFFFSVIFPQVKKGKDIGMPWLQVNSESTFPLSPALINITGGIIENLQHRDNAVAGSVCSADVRTRCPNIVDAQADTTSALRNFGRLFQRIINAVNTVILHGQQKTRRHLRFWRAGVE